MARQRKSKGLGGFSARLLVCGALMGLAVPTAGLALGGVDGRGVLLSARGSFASFTPASVSPELARLLADKPTAKGRMMRFTPAGAANRPDRSVTVAIRVDEESARAISVRSGIAAAQGEPGAGETKLVIAPTRFNLGIARGYKSFAQPAAAASAPSTLQRIEMPDLSTFKPAGDSAMDSDRFNARVSVEAKGSAGRLPASMDPLGKRSVDVAGSYRLSRNFDVTAGVRYSQQNERLSPLTDGRQDAQAVYVGTQFRF